MVVNYKNTGWEVITQRAHGVLAAQVAMHWKEKERPERWMETLIAIADHDEAEVELDGENLLTETGGPLNFSMKQFDEKHCEQMAMLTITKSRYIALLVSMHMDFLYRKEEKQNSRLHKFLEHQRKLRSSWEKELGLEKEQAERIYYLLEWADAFSLLLCQQQVQPQQRGIEISTGPDGKIYQLIQLEDGVLTVDPWPFEPDKFTLTCESREIEQLHFSSSAEFRKAFIEATVKEQVWHIAKRTVKKPAKV